MDKKMVDVSYQAIIACFVVVLVVLPRLIQASQAQSSSTVFLPFISARGFDHVVINELLALNGTVNMDPTVSRFEDWIELYNPTSDAVDLTGYYLSDDPEEPTQWQFPDGTVLNLRSHLMIPALGFEKAGLYANFKLSDNGETIMLSAPDGRVVDTVLFEDQEADMSFGRISDGNAQMGYFGQPTPGEGNRDGLFHQDKNDVPEFAQKSGFYPVTQAITLSHAADTAVYYTIDGSTPTEQSTLYTGVPIVVDETAVIKARAYGAGQHPSEITAATYLISESFDLPVLSIGVTPDYFWDDEVGIYVTGTNGIGKSLCGGAVANVYQDWERPITIELFEESGDRAFLMNAGAKIFGGCTRDYRYPQKSLAIHFRDMYGDDTLNYHLFDDSVTKFHALVLRNSGNDNSSTMMRDAIMQNVLVDTTDWDGRRTTPAVVLINGAYWGIQNIREKLNEDYLEERYDVDAKEVDILDLSGEVSEGSSAHYDALIAYISEHDLADPDHFAYVETQMDVDQYIDYVIGHIYFANADWPHRNVKFWRPQSDDGRWRWFTFDMDFGMTLEPFAAGVAYPALELALAVDVEGRPDWSTHLFRQLIRNQSFQDALVQRMSIYIDTGFSAENVSAAIDTYKSRLEPEMPNHIGRWERPETMEAWQSNVDVLYHFAEQRPAIVRRNLENYFTLPNDRITIDLASTGGEIHVNTVELEAGASISVYPNLPLTFDAVPAPNYAFVRWEGAVTGTDALVSATFDSDQSIVAIFEPFPQPVINEIHYNPSGDLQGDDALYEFIELYNPYNSAIDVTGYQITDGIAFTFTEETIMQPNSIIVLAQTADTYSDLSVPVFQWESGGLKNSGETLELSDAAGNIVDEVPYSDDGDWATSPDGEGASLSLIVADSDNRLPGSWQASDTLGGTPGQQNDFAPILNVHR